MGCHPSRLQAQCCAADTLGYSSNLRLDLLAKRCAASTCLTGTVQRPAFLAQECRRLPQLPDQQEQAAQASDQMHESSHLIQAVLKDGASFLLMLTVEAEKQRNQGLALAKWHLESRLFQD